MIVTLVKEQ